MENINELTKNIVNIFGEKGEKWIRNLPILVETLTEYWELNHLTPVDNMTFNYVAKATFSTNQPIILKISCDMKTIANEKEALIFFNGSGSIQLIDYNEKYNALLLQQAVPGITLKSFYPIHVEYVINCYVDTMQKLHSKHLPSKYHYPHVSDWLTAIDNLKPNEPCPSYLLEKAISLKNALLASMTSQTFLHGDLHHDNILQDANNWLAIDPKGIIGEPEFEIAAFDFMYINELANKIDTKNIFESRVAMLAQKANLSAQRIKDWVFVRLILMAAWLIEDNDDPSGAIKLAKILA